MKIAVIGSRNFDDYNLLENILKKEEITEIISGGARGADSLAARYAYEYGLNLVEFKPDWNNIDVKGAVIKYHKDGKAYNAIAGHMRNNSIIQYCDKVIAFWDEESKGTLDSLNKAKKLNKKIEIVKFKLINNA